MSIGITGIGWVTATNMGTLKDLSSFDLTDGPLPEIPFSGLGPAARRMDAYSRLGMTAVSLALKDAGLLEWVEKRPFGIVAATEYACLATDFAYFETVKTVGASPGLFSYTLPSVFLGEAAILFGLTGPTYAVNGKNPLDVGGLVLSLESIETGEADTMLCGIVNPPCPPMLHPVKQVPAGAVFLVVERLPAGKTSYGTLRFSSEGGIEFGGTDISDLPDLVRRCLTAWLTG